MTRLWHVDAFTGDVTLVAAGTTTITATFAGDEKYLPSEASYVLTVEPSSDPTAIEDVRIESEKAQKPPFGKERKRDDRQGQNAQIPARTEDDCRQLQRQDQDRDEMVLPLHEIRCIQQYQFHCKEHDRQGESV